MTRAEKALQYFIIAVPEDKEQAEAYFWARRALNAAIRAERADGESGSMLTNADLLARAEAAEARAEKAEKERDAAVEDILGDDYDIDRLRELVQADRDGRCVVLPCKVGDVLYSAFPLCGINTHQVRKFERNSEGDFACSALMIPLSDFGKTVFLTRESAETALEKTEG